MFLIVEERRKDVTEKLSRNVKVCSLIGGICRQLPAYFSIHVVSSSSHWEDLENNDQTRSKDSHHPNVLYLIFNAIFQYTNQRFLRKWLILVLSRRFTRVTWSILPNQITGSIQSTRVTSKVLGQISGGERWGNFSSVQFSRSVLSNSLWCHRLQHTSLPCPSPTPRACSNSCPSSRWCHPIISSSVDPFPLAFNLFQHQDLFKWVSSLYQVAKILEFQLQHQSFQWTPRTDLL